MAASLNVRKGFWIDHQASLFNSALEFCINIGFSMTNNQTRVPIAVL